MTARASFVQIDESLFVHRSRKVDAIRHPQRYSQFLGARALRAVANHNQTYRTIDVLHCAHRQIGTLNRLEPPDEQHVVAVWSWAETAGKRGRMVQRLCCQPVVL